MSRTPRPQARRTLAKQPAPPGLYASKYDPDLAGAICRRIAAGEAIAAICADPAMPTGKTLWQWARSHPPFAAMKAHALKVARARALAARDEAEKSRRKPPPPPARDAARPPELRSPPPEGVEMGEARRVAWNRGLDGYALGDGRARTVLAWLALGETVAQACARPGAPSVGTVYNWLKRHPAFLAAYRAAKAKGADEVVDGSCEHLEWEGERKSWVTLRRTVRAAERRARRLALKRYALPAGPDEVRVVVREPDGTERVVYEGGPLERP